MTKWLAASIGLLIPLTPSNSPAQSLGSGRYVLRGDPSAWMEMWSPLLPIGDLQRPTASPPHLPALLIAPSPRVGQVWSAGNPAALPFELDTSARAEFRVGRDEAGGDYRRPLDPDRQVSTELSGLAWQRLSRHVGAVGRAKLHTQALDDGTFASGFEPYSSSPLIPTDTTEPLLEQSSVALEGAMGWQREAWGLGVALGYSVAEGKARRTTVARVRRSASPGVKLGITRSFQRPKLTLGAYSHRVERNETVQVVANPTTARIYQLEGYSEVEPLDFTPSAGIYYRRIERDGTAFGASATGTLMAVNWALFGELGKLDEVQSSVPSDDPTTDDWHTSGLSFGFGAQRALFGKRLVTTVHVASTSFDGEAHRADLDGIIYLSKETALSVSADVRFTPRHGHWMAASTFATLRRSRKVRDALAGLSSDIVTWMPALTIETARNLRAGTALSVAYGASLYSSISTIPAGEQLGPVFGALIAPELEYYGTPALAQRGAFTVRWQARASTAFWILAAYERTAARASALETPFQPEGRYSGWGFTAGVILGP